MSLGTFRKRVELLEKLLKPKIEAAAAASAPAPEGIDDTLTLLEFILSPPKTPEEEAEYQRLRALYPECDTRTAAELEHEMNELIRKGEW